MRNPRSWSFGLPVALAIVAGFLLPATASAGTRVYTAAADASVNGRAPTRNYGGVRVLRVDAAPKVRSYLRFNVRGLSGPVLQATLWIYARTGSKKGYEVRGTRSRLWRERALTYRNAPPVYPVAASSGPLRAGAWTKVDVTNLVARNGVVSIALTTSATTEIRLASREAEVSAPRLVVSTASMGTTIAPVADAYVNAQKPKANYGTVTKLRADGSPLIRSYVRFDVAGLSAPVTRATLRAYSVSSLKQGYDVHGVTDNTWDERTLTYANAPSPSSGTVASSAQVSAGTWVTIDVTPLVDGNGSVSLALTTTSTTAASLDSREVSSYAPQLAIETYSAPPPPAPGYTVKGLMASSRADRASIASLGFNAVTVGPYRDRLDVLASYGTGGLVWLGGYDNMTCSFVETDDWVRSHVTAIADHPAVIGYDVDNEPHAADCPTAPQQMRERNALVKSLDPGEDTYMTLHEAAEFDDFIGSADILRISGYPCSHENGCRYAQKITDRVTAARAAGWTRIFGGVQAFGDEYYRLPTPDEEQIILDTWRNAGVEGIVTYVWDYSDPVVLRDHPELWDVLRRENGR